MKKITIAIDGFAGCGKSTLARQVAAHLNYLFLDTGAMYRAVTLYMLDNNIDWNDPQSVSNALQAIHLEMKFPGEGKATSGQAQIFLNGINVEGQIRNTRITDRVSELAAVPSVRKFLVAQQQEIGKNGGIVLDGRDIGTVVFPRAELKIFVTARMEVRVRRRFLELQANGIQISEQAILENLIKRDREETTRADSPLKMADDAILLDNSDMSQEEQLDWVLQLVQKNFT